MDAATELLQVERRGPAAWLWLNRPEVLNALSTPLVTAIGDALARMKRMQGFNVLHPFGWDAFGLPAENAAIKHGIHPEDSTRGNISHMKGQLQRMGISYAWDRELATCDAEYYKWNQWLFIRMFEKGLAYRRRSSVNWCPKDNTVLANEQVVDGGCWRCGTPVETRDLEQWFFRITAYADELLDATDGLSAWPEKVLTMQRNWIGRSQGARVTFALEGDASTPIEVFTTRIDTIHGATFVLLGYALHFPAARFVEAADPQGTSSRPTNGRAMSPGSIGSTVMPHRYAAKSAPGSASTRVASPRASRSRSAPHISRLAPSKKSSGTHGSEPIAPACSTPIGSPNASRPAPSEGGSISSDEPEPSSFSTRRAASENTACTSPTRSGTSATGTRRT